MNSLTHGIGILGLGSALPEKVLTNFDLEKMVDTSDEWIIKRTGISERRILERETPAYVLGVEAAKKAIDDAGLKPEEIDLIIVTTSCPDYLSPSISCIIQKEIKAKNSAAFDLNAACSGFIYGLTTAQQFISTGYYKNVLVVACEGLSKIVDWEDRNTCILFGDGAGAVVLGAVEKEYGIIDTELGADGSMGHFITIPCCHLSNEDKEKRLHENKMVLWMDGTEVFKFAVNIMAQAVEKVLEKCNITLDDVQLIIPHQANIRIIDGASKKMGILFEKVYSNVHKYGNISSASIPVALEEAWKSGRISKGDNIVLVGFGGGLTWASALVKWNR
ncbi:MAG TPA: ketoacyl-ACP synthase III [Clostridiaceae bacterium]|nr:ketoacyl-ACP synthase III [Clostridiaceae bacterium]